MISFKSFSQIKISLTNQYLERKTQKSRERFALKNVHRVNVKRTIKGSIREIKVSLVNGNALYINALEDFEQFKERLLANIEKNVKVKEFSGPIDYDHKMFYVVFGLLVGFGIPIIIYILIGLNYNILKNLSFVFASYVILMGIYFILGKPISKSYGGNTKLVDYLLGSIITCLGIYIFVS